MNEAVAWTPEGTEADRRAAPVPERRTLPAFGPVPTEPASTELGRAQAKLNSLVRALDRPADGPTPDPRGARPVAAAAEAKLDTPKVVRSLADAIAEISRRQSALDRGPPPEARAVPSTARARRTASGDPPGSSTSRARAGRPDAAGLLAPGVVPAMTSLQREVASLGRSLEGLAPRDSVAAIEAAVRDLSTRVGGAVAPPRAALDEVRSPLDDLRDGDGDGDGAGVQALERRVAALADKIDAAIAGQVRPDAIDQLAKRIDRVHASLETKPPAPAAPAVDLAPLEALVTGLVGRVDALRRSAEEVQGLEGMVHRLAAKLDAARDPSADAEVFADLQAQVGKLAQRIDRSDAGLTAIVSVERSLGEIFAQLEETREAAIGAAEGAARTAARDTLRAAMQGSALGAPRLAGETDAVAEELQQLRVARDAADARMAALLSTVNLTLEQVVGRLLAVEADRAGAVPPSLAELAPASPAAPIRKPEPSREVMDLAGGDFPIEPGSAAPARPRAPQPDGAAPDVKADPAQFIAAARRAAQAAAQEHAGRTSTAAASKARGGSAPILAEEAGPSLFGRVKSRASASRRPLLLSLAGLVLLLGAAQVARLSLPAPGAVALGAAPAPADADRPKVTATADQPDAMAATAPVPTAEPSPAAKPVAEAAPEVKALPSLAMGPPAAHPAAPDDAPPGIGDGLRDLADGGSAAAQYEVAVRLADGRGVARDLKGAAAWFEKAAKQGLAPAEYRLGSLYEKGLGVARDAARSVDWYGKAAEDGNVRAMHNLAVLSAEGAGGKSDYAKAATWFSKASQMGVRDSQFNLAILYARGLGLEQSLIESYKWFTIAAAQGDEDAAKKRDEVGARLDPKALASAKAAADDFKPLIPLKAANEVQPPPGGWDAVAPSHPAPPSDGGAKPLGARVSSM